MNEVFGSSKGSVIGNCSIRVVRVVPPAVGAATGARASISRVAKIGVAVAMYGCGTHYGIIDGDVLLSAMLPSDVMFTATWHWYFAVGACDGHHYAWALPFHGMCNTDVI